MGENIEGMRDSKYSDPFMILTKHFFPDVYNHVKGHVLKVCLLKSRKETPQKLTQLSPRSHPRHLVGKRTA